MLRRLGLVVLLLLAPTVVRADDSPERLLPAGTQVYLRWDGIAAHRDAYRRSALGQTLQGDTGEFARGVFKQAQDLLSGAVVQELLQGTSPEKLQKIQADAASVPLLLDLFAQHGVLLAADLHGLEPPDFGQVIVIVPNVGREAEVFLAAIRLATSLGKQEIKERKIEGRTVYQLADSPVPVAWWVEGAHLVLSGGSNLPETVIKQFDDKGQHLPDNPLFQRLQQFKEFETAARAFIDMSALAEKFGKGHPEVTKVMAETGLDNIKNITFYSGFDGPVDHGVTELELAGPRKGLLTLLDTKPFTLADLPPLPADAPSWTMTNLDPKVAYDEGLKALETGIRLTAPDELPKVRANIRGLNDLLGIDVRKDLLETLDDRLVQYDGGLTDGAIFFSQTYLWRVKDAKKLEDSLNQAIKGAGRAAGVDVSLRKRSYHGAELHEVHVRAQGFLFVPTYTIYKGWLAASYYPQSVQGYVLRANGELPTWKPDQHTLQALEKMPKEFVSVSMADPRPGLKLALALAPLIGGTVNSFVPDSKFDVGAVPNANEATRHLFPNVSVVTTDKNTVRLETRASLGLPIDTNTLFGLQLLAQFAFRNQ